MKAMDDKYDIVLIRYGNCEKKYAFYAPYQSGIDRGDSVIVRDSAGHETTVKVANVYEIDGDTASGILTQIIVCEVLGIKEIKKRIRAKVVRYETD